MPSEKLLRNLRVMRAVRNWELQEVAKRAGISSLTVSRIFNGDTENPGVETLAKIVEALGYTMDQLFSDQLPTENPQIPAQEALPVKPGKAARTRSKGRTLPADNG